MKPDKHFLGGTGIVLVTLCLIALTWFGAYRSIRARDAETRSQVTATLSNYALLLSEQINRQMLALEQTLQTFAAQYEADPDGFDLEASRRKAIMLDAISRDMILTDAAGIVRQSSIDTAVNENFSGRDYFIALSDPKTAPQMTYIGPAAIDNFMRQWHMNIARAIHTPDGKFAGVIDADFRISTISEVFTQTNLGTGAFMTLVGDDDGKMRGVFGPTSIDPDVGIAETRMFAAIQNGESGIWTGPTATDPDPRIHAYRRIAGRPLVLVVAISEVTAMRPALTWQRLSIGAAGAVSTLLIVIAALLLSQNRLAQQRAKAAAEERAVTAAAYAQLEVARSQISIKAEHLQATLSGMTDGVSMFDSHLCLVEWNASFPEIAGVPAEILRVGLPMEDILRAQVAGGQFGRIADPEGEIERRTERLRASPYGVFQRTRPDGHTIELRRNKLPDGGFVTLYADVTEYKHTEEELRRARAEAESVNAAKTRFVAIVSHEIRTPLNTLLNTIRLLSDSVLAPAQRSLLATAQQSGNVLYMLINDILEMSQMEAGKLSIRPSLFDLRQLMESSVELFVPQAAERRITISIDIAPGTPAALLSDPGRLRQVQLNLLSNALKYAKPGTVWLTAEPGATPREAVRLSVKDAGPVIDRQARDRLFRPFSRLERPEGDDLTGTGLGLSICLHLMTLMGGQIGCEPWTNEDGEIGNAFWFTLPASALPFRDAEDGPGRAEVPGEARSAFWQEPENFNLPPLETRTFTAADLERRTPRTRVLLVDDITANQMVTATLLRREGHLVDVVSSGLAAIDAVSKQPYDLIFMDIFMPGMSGQEATEIIRSLAEPAASTPIVALTANVMPEDEDVFRAAGMDGFLTKPVSLSGLLDVLRAKVWSARIRRRETAPLAEAAPPPPQHDLWEVLSYSRVRELQTNLPPETFATLVEECISDLDHRMPALRRAMSSGNTGAITAHAHAMVGMAAGYGMAALETRLRMVMGAAKEGDVYSLGSAAVTGIEDDMREAAKVLRDVAHGVYTARAD